MALYELTIVCEYFGQLTVNRWNYTMTGTTAAVTGSFALAKAFGVVPINNGTEFPTGSVMRFIQAIQTGGVRYREAIVSNVYSVTDFYTVGYTVPIAGVTGGGSELSPSVAYGFRTNQVRRDVARGQKRLTGVPSAATVNGGGYTATFFASLNNVASAMTANITYADEGNTITFAPVVCSKQQYVPPSGARAYRYYPTLAEQMQHTATGCVWEVVTNTRTQRSRQYGKGQ